MATTGLDDAGPALSLFILPGINAEQPGQWVEGRLEEMMDGYLGTATVRGTDSETAKKSVRMYSAMIPKDEHSLFRRDDCVGGFSAIIFDVDGKDGKLWPEELEEELDGVAYAVHTTWSNSADSPRSRFIFPLSRIVSGTEPERLRVMNAQMWIAIYDKMGQPKGIDPSTTDLSRAYFFPSCPQERAADFQSFWKNGAPLDPDELMAMVDPVTAQNRLLAMRQHDKGRGRTDGQTLSAQQEVHSASTNMAASSSSLGSTQSTVIEGSRNNELFMLAKDLLRTYPENPGKARGLIALANNGFVPPLGVREVETTLNSAAKSLAAEAIAESAKQQLAAPAAIPEVPAAADPEPFSFADMVDYPIPEPKWLIRGVLEFAQVGSLYADGGLGKSLLITQMAVSRAIGREFITRAMEFLPNAEGNHRTLMVNCEDGMDKMRRTLRGVCDHYDVTERDLGDNVIGWDRRGMNNSLMDWGSKSTTGVVTQFWFELRARIIHLRASLVILDTRDDFFSGETANNAQARQFIQQTLTTLARDTGCAILLIGHVSADESQSGQGKGFSGAMAWKNTPRMLLNMTAIEGTAGFNSRPLVKLELKKANNAQPRVLSTMRQEYPVWVDNDETPSADVQNAALEHAAITGSVGSNGNINPLIHTLRERWLDAAIRRHVMEYRQHLDPSVRARSNSLAGLLFDSSVNHNFFTSKKDVQMALESMVERGALIRLPVLQFGQDGKNPRRGETLVPPEHEALWRSVCEKREWTEDDRESWQLAVQSDLDIMRGKVAEIEAETGQEYLDKKTDFEA